VAPKLEPAGHQPEREACVFIASGGVVVALHESTGAVLWQTALPGSGSLITLFTSGSRLFCASQGRVWALDSRSGKILWTNELKQLGRGLIDMATTANPNDAPTETDQGLARYTMTPYGG